MSDRALLAELARGPCSGSALARRLGLTRAAVWKRVEALRAAGVEIDARAGRGYALAAPLELLDAEAIRAAMRERGRLGTLEVAWEIDSTNAELLRRGDARTPQAQAVADNAVLLAERQTVGRGRRDRTWASPLAAHVYLSLHRRFDAGVARLAGLSLAVGVAAAEALRALGFEAVALKWPNDLVVVRDDTVAKLGGILIEFGGEAGGPVRAVIGLGLNVRMPEVAAHAIDQPWCDLAALSNAAPPSRNRIAAALLDALLPALDAFDAQGFEPFLARFAALDALARREIVVHAGDRTMTGLALGVTADGGLRVRHADGERVWHAGEVSIRGQKTEDRGQKKRRQTTDDR